MKKLLIIIIGLVILSCKTTNAGQNYQTNLPPEEKIQCRIIVKRFKATTQDYEPVEDAKVTVIGSQKELPRPADYIVLGSMEIVATQECRLDEVLDAIKTGAGGFGANYVLPWNVQTKSSDAFETTIDKWIREKPVNTYILLRKENLLL